MLLVLSILGMVLYPLVGVIYTMLLWRTWKNAWDRREAEALTPPRVRLWQFLLFPMATLAGNRVGDRCSDMELRLFQKGWHEVPALAVVYQRLRENGECDGMFEWTGAHVLFWPATLAVHLFVLCGVVVCLAFEACMVLADAVGRLFPKALFQ